MPAGVVPITEVLEGEDEYTAEDSKYRDSLFKNSVAAMVGSKGLPVGV